MISIINPIMPLCFDFTNYQKIIKDDLNHGKTTIQAVMKRIF